MVHGNNPGNIRRVQGKPWVGEIVPSPWESGFVQFVDLTSGYRAMIVLLQTYITKYGLDTISKMIYRWAPPAENPTENYISFVAGYTGMSRDQSISAGDLQHLGLIALGMSDFENSGDITQADVSAVNQALAMVPGSPAGNQASTAGENWPLILFSLGAIYMLIKKTP